MATERGTDRAYTSAVQALNDFAPAARALISGLLAAEGIRVHSVTSRMKTPDSVGRKLALKGERYRSPGELHDLLGLRVITFFPDEVDLVSAVIEHEFNVDRENSVDKRADLSPDRFGYLSRHYVLKFSDERLALREHERFQGCVFELQIRSILQHAWAEIEHDLGYHADGVPTQFRRRFSRLAGLLEVADDEFARLRDDVVAHKSEVAESISEKQIDVELDQDSLGAYVSGNEFLQEFARFLADAYSVDVDRSDLGGLSSSVARLKFFDLRTIADVDRALRENEPLLRPFARHWIGERLQGPINLTIGLFYLAYVLAGSAGNVSRVREYLDYSHIGRPEDDLAQSVVDVMSAARQDVHDAAQ